MKLRWISILVMLLATSFPALANTPGKHSVALSWAESGCPACTFNVYRSTTANACSGNPTPIATGLQVTGYDDTNVTLGTTYYYDVTAVNQATGGESACSNEVQIAVPPITTPVPSGLAGTVQ